MTSEPRRGSGPVARVARTADRACHGPRDGSGTAGGRACLAIGLMCLGLVIQAWPVSADGPDAGLEVIGRVPLADADAADMIEAPSLVCGADGTLHVAWVSETAPGVRTILLASAAPGAPLGPPRTLATTGVFVSESTMPGRGGPPRTVRRPLRTAPHLARMPAGGAAEALVVVYTAAEPDDVATVRPMMMRSDDGGRTFSEPTPLERAEAVRPTFTGCGVGADGRLLFSWLDHRLGVQVPALAATGPGTTAFLPETLLEQSVGPRGVCPCCPTACAGDADGTVFLAFRNQVDGFRDIHVARRAAAADRFETVAPVVPPTWPFDGCPHDGPSLNLHEGLLTVTWMDAHEDVPRVYVASSRTDPLAFSRPVRLDPDAPGAQGNARLCRDSAGVLHAVWERSSDATDGHAHGGRRGGPPGGEDGPAAGPQAAGGHAAHAGGGRLTMHARHVAGTWSSPRPVAAAPGVLQTRPAIAAGPAGAVAVAFFERTVEGKELVVAAASRSAADGSSGLLTATTPEPGKRAGGRTMHPGALAYLQYCAGCHGASGAGDGPAASALPQPPRAFASTQWRGPRTRETIRRSILEGVAGTPMKAVPELPPDAVDGVVAHVAALAGIETGDTSSLRVLETPVAVGPLALADAAGTACGLPVDARLTLVHVWGTTCGACVAEMPDVERLGADLAGRGLAVVHLCVDADGPTAHRVAREAAPTARVVVDPTGLAGDRLGARLLPAVRLLDREGRIVARGDGATDWRSPRLRNDLLTLLERAPAPPPPAEPGRARP
jgi:mono/diheme cytochrome c family protein